MKQVLKLEFCWGLQRCTILLWKISFHSFMKFRQLLHKSLHILKEFFVTLRIAGSPCQFKFSYEPQATSDGEVFKGRFFG